MHSPTPLHVVVIDDEPAMRDLYRDILADEPCRVTVMSHDEWNQRLGTDDSYSLIVIDPIRNDWSLDWTSLERLICDPDLGRLPVVLSTWSDAITDRPDITNKVTVLKKPFDLDDLIGLLDIAHVHSQA